MMVLKLRLKITSYFDQICPEETAEAFFPEGHQVPTYCLQKRKPQYGTSTRYVPVDYYHYQIDYSSFLPLPLFFLPLLPPFFFISFLSFPLPYMIRDHVSTILSPSAQFSTRPQLTLTGSYHAISIASYNMQISVVHAASNQVGA